MKLENVDFWKDRDCNECHGQHDVKEVYVGANVIALCKSCRIKLKNLLDNE